MDLTAFPYRLYLGGKTGNNAKRKKDKQMTTLKLKCEYQNTDGIVTYIEGTQLKGEKFEEIRRVDFFRGDIPSTDNNIVAYLTNYGLRAILADRTSDAKNLGVNKLDWMQEIFEQFKQGQWTVKRVATGGVDRAMIHLIVELKGCTAIEAEGALKQASKEWKEAVKEKYEDELTRIRKDLAAASVVDLTDL